MRIYLQTNMRAWLLWVLACLCICIGQAASAQSHGPEQPQIEAVRGAGWDDANPPAAGWMHVTLPDMWRKRWPDHDGVVWYRLRWDATDAASANESGSALIDAMRMTGAVYFNGRLIYQDPHLHEPLSRSANYPRLHKLDPQRLRPRGNELLVRVTGYAAYRGGLGSVDLQPYRQGLLDYSHNLRASQYLHWASMGITLAMALIFGGLWLSRRSESVYGWFAARSLMWLPIAYVQVTDEISPFPDTRAWIAFSTIAVVLFCVSTAMFLIRFADARMPHAERALKTCAVIAVASMMLSDDRSTPPFSSFWVAMSLLLYLVASAGFMVHAVRTRKREHLALAACLTLTCLAAVHDGASALNIIKTDAMYSIRVSLIVLVCMALLLAWRHAQSMRLVERYNQTLNDEVEKAGKQLKQSLQREHELQLSQSRIADRLAILSDLHDGLGSTLSSHILGLKSQPDTPPQVLIALQELQEELRLIVEQPVDRDCVSITDAIAPLRFRIERAMTAQSITTHWEMKDLDELQLKQSRMLDLLRILQEACSNILRHSRARRVEIRLERTGDRLKLMVHDDGIGLPQVHAGMSDGDARATRAGLGMASFRQRASRLGATFDLHNQSHGAGVMLVLDMPLESCRADNQALQSSMGVNAARSSQALLHP